MARRISRTAGGKRRRTTATRRTSIPPARQIDGLGGSFSQLLRKLGGASASLEQSRRPMRRR